MIRWEGKFTKVAFVAALILGLAGPAAAATGSSGKGSSGKATKLDKELTARAGKIGRSRVIVRVKAGAEASSEVRKLGGKVGRQLHSIGGLAIELPNAALHRLAERSEIVSLHFDRPTGGEMNRAAVTVGSREARRQFGSTGAGIGVAVIDSGISSWHNDLLRLGDSSLIKSANGQRVVGFVDFVNGRTSTYDDNGHGTHVAGIIAGNGFDTFGSRAGIAPAAHLVGLKVLDAQGRGRISDVIAAMDWLLVNAAAYNIRVANLSVGAAVTESYTTDPLALSVKRVVDAGITVVTAAGNLGTRSDGMLQYGAITAPGNAPWVLTVGASSHQGTVDRRDDVMGRYSSRGPTAIDYGAKPDVVAPGTGIASLSDPTSTLYATRSAYLLSGSFWSPYKPYLSLTGTSMAAPMVTGTVALMLEANPSLTPNMVKAIVQYTAQQYQGYDALTQGAGFLNSYGAVQLARFFRAARAGDSFAVPAAWSKQIIWGNRRIKGGAIRPNANAYELGVTWGAAFDRDGDNIVWGTLFGGAGDNIVWGTFDGLHSENIVWGTVLNNLGENIVWGTYSEGDNIVWGTFGTVDNIVWGTDCGGSNCDNVVWGTATGLVDNIVWGTAAQGDNIVWGTSGLIDNIVWGTSSEQDNLTWGNSGADAVMFDDSESPPVSYDEAVWDSLFQADPVTSTETTTTSIVGGL